MRTNITITGTGTPIAHPGLAGPGVLVRHDNMALQFDAGRSTVTRLIEAGLDLRELTAVFLTHHHSDHVVGLADLLMTRWLEDVVGDGGPPLPVFAPVGDAAELARHILDPWKSEIRLRQEHSGRSASPAAQVHAFPATLEPSQVFASGSLRVSALGVHHEPVIPAVGFRVDTPQGSVVISGDTRVCPEMEVLAKDANILVHEAFRKRGTQGLLSDPDAISAYHADAVAVGALADRAGVGTLVLTHLIPPLNHEGDADAFTEDTRCGGFTGPVIVARDLEVVELFA